MSDANRPLYIGVFLAGQGKCGTSSIADCLFQHPQITSVRKDPVAQARLAGMRQRRRWTHQSLKEPCIMWSRIEGAVIDWHQGLVRWPRVPRKGLNKNSPQDMGYAQKFDAGLAQCLPQTPQTRPSDWQTLATDCTPRYFDSPGCAEAIKFLYPDARIIISLRHPTDWVYSYHYMMVLQSNQEPQCRFFVRVSDFTPETAKDSYKRHLRAVEDIFYKLILDN